MSTPPSSLEKSNWLHNAPIFDNFPSFANSELSKKLRWRKSGKKVQPPLLGYGFVVHDFVRIRNDKVLVLPLPEPGMKDLEHMLQGDAHRRATYGTYAWQRMVKYMQSELGSSRIRFHYFQPVNVGPASVPRTAMVISFYTNEASIAQRAMYDGPLGEAARQLVKNIFELPEDCQPRWYFDAMACIQEDRVRPEEWYGN